MSTQTFKSKLRLTIGTKLVGIIAALLLSSVASLIWVSTSMFSQSSSDSIQQMNLDTAGSLATRVRESFEGFTNRMRMLGTIIIEQSASMEVRDKLKDEFFSKERDLLALYVYSGADSAAPVVQTKAISPEMATLGDPDGEKSLALLASEKDLALSRVSRGEALLASVRLPDGAPAIALSIPFITAPGTKDRFTHTLTAVIKQTRFAKAFSESDSITSYLVDHKGRLLAHPDASRVAAREPMSQVKIVQMMLDGKSPNGQQNYQDPTTKEAKLGAYMLVGFGGLGVVSEVPAAKAFEAAEGVKRNSIFLGLSITCIAFLMGYLYSGTITRPIKQLVEAARRISQGDFLIDLKPKGRDEVATLAFAFNDMAKGLEERDKVKATFNKFHNKEIADKLLSGEVKLGGERKEATIFFSDVRGFTAMSESMEPEQVVEMLNEYMTRMVSIIRSHHGIVDKYVGDAIMAIWGVPLAGTDDQGNAVKACIEMRAELSRLNELRISRGQTALKIGMGLNTGSVIAGNIGSDEKMEYTVIGDSVNLASRMESMTKEYGTDFLVPKVIQDRLKDRFIFVPQKSVKVKGKSQAIEIFTVRGYFDANGQEVIVETPYSSYESEKSDKAVHDKPAAPVAEPPVVLKSASADEWFVQFGADALGPFNESEIRDGIAKQEFLPETLVSRSKEGPWAPLSENVVLPVVEEAAPAMELVALEEISEPGPQAAIPTPPPAPSMPPRFNPPAETEAKRPGRRRRNSQGTQVTLAPTETASATVVELQPLEVVEADPKKAA